MVMYQQYYSLMKRDGKSDIKGQLIVRHLVLSQSISVINTNIELCRGLMMVMDNKNKHLFNTASLQLMNM